jgi:predicted HicB family RNase H-like nuclease
MASKSTHFSLRLHPDLKRRAEKAAADDQRPLSSLVKSLLHNHCKEREGDAGAPKPGKRGQK